MADHQRKRVLFVVDYDRDGYLVFKVNLKDLFSVDADPAPAPAAKTEMEMLPLPRPVARFQSQACREAIAFGLSGATIVGLSHTQTYTYDTKALTAGSGPTTGGIKYGTILLPVGAEIYALGLFPQMGGPEARPHLEALSLSPDALAWRALPEPPPELRRVDLDSVGRRPCCKVKTCFTMGGRLWLSARGQGTYSLSTSTPGTWRKEGPWELPVHGFSAVYVLELGRLLGFCPRRQCLSACDMEARPPVVREVWKETWPWECVKMGYGINPEGSLVYLGNGMLCITRLVDNQAASALCVQAVQLQLHEQRRRVKMVKRRIRCYTMSTIAQRGYALQPSSSTAA